MIMNRTSVQGSDEAPVSSMHDAVLAAPAFAPLYAVAALGAVVLGPEAEVER